jgi:hypothetical protein
MFHVILRFFEDSHKLTTGSFFFFVDSVQVTRQQHSGCVKIYPLPGLTSSSNVSYKTFWKN